MVLVMDGAGWHKAKNLQVPDNIEIILLPPYSPELNPVERLWQYLKQNTIKNKVYKTLNLLKDIVAKFLNQITPVAIMTICNINYLSN
jgi:transposase